MNIRCLVLDLCFTLTDHALGTASQRDAQAHGRLSHRTAAGSSGATASAAGGHAPADCTGIHHVASPVGLHSSANDPGQPLDPVRAARAAPPPADRPRRHDLDPGVDARTGADQARTWTTCCGTGSSPTCQPRRQAHPGREDAEQRADLAADRRMLARRQVHLPAAPPGQLDRVAERVLGSGLAPGRDRRFDESTVKALRYMRSLEDARRDCRATHPLRGPDREAGT